MAKRPERPLEREEDGRLIVEFCVEGPPVTWRVRKEDRDRLQAWKDRVARAARAMMPDDEAAVSEDVGVFLSEFSKARTLDRDNMAKPILDALQGIVYANDRQVLHLRSEWCNIEGRYEVRSMSPSIGRAMSRGHEFVWVRVRAHQPRTFLR